MTPPLNKADVLSGETAESRADVVPVWSGPMKTTLDGARSESRSGYRQRYRLPPSGNGQAGTPRRNRLPMTAAVVSGGHLDDLLVGEPGQPVEPVDVVCGQTLGLWMAAGPTASVGLSGSNPPRLPPSDAAGKPADGARDVDIARSDGHFSQLAARGAAFL